MKTLINNQTIFLDKANNPSKKFFSLIGKKNIKIGLHSPTYNKWQGILKFGKWFLTKTK